MIDNKNILISGAGIAGLTLAYWLQQYGFTPTVIEKRPNLNDRGYMIDFYGSGYDVAEKIWALFSGHARGPGDSHLYPEIILKLAWHIFFSTPLCSRDSARCLPDRLVRRA